MKQISETAQEFFRSKLLEIHKDPALVEIIISWEKLIGPELYLHCEPMQIVSRYVTAEETGKFVDELLNKKEKILQISVSNPSVASKVRLVGSELVQRIRLHFGYYVVNKVAIDLKNSLRV